MSQLEAWQMVYIQQSFLDSRHGAISCTTCHSGNSSIDVKDDAHVGIVAAPSENPDQYCGTCHGDISSGSTSNLHVNLAGYYQRIENRLGYDISSDPNLVESFNQECGKCHASCGQCHVSRPVSVDGGFIQGHTFIREPRMRDNCTACHGSRVGAEYFGENQGMKSDVHWLPNAKRCVFCHEGEAMHSSSALAEYRYDDADLVRCEDCHIDTQESNDYHSTHWGDLSCNVCHSQPYKSCNGCHTGGEGITGSSYMTFKIAKNPIRSSGRKYKIVTVRHIPIVPDTYSSWGLADLPNFDSEPTWKYATPHNVQRWTAQTDTTGGKLCMDNCHNNPEIYLTIDDLEPFEVEANRDIVLTIED